MTNRQLQEHCEAEFENIEMVVSQLTVALEARVEGLSTIELAGVAALLHNFYNGVENVLKRILLFKQAEMKDSPTWHKDLLKAAFDTGMISTNLYEILSGYLSFRHFFVHSYSFTLRWDEMKPLVDRIVETFTQFKSEIDVYLGKAI